ncbi:hypothetical protein DICA1_F17436 [Diutina catenulata]
MNGENNSIDRLEDQLIDHPDAETRRDFASGLDGTFQSKLKAMADQIEHAADNEEGGDGDDIGDDSMMSDMNYQFLITRSHLEYVYHDQDSLDTELNMWFTYHDLLDIGGLEDLADHYKRELSDIAEESGYSNAATSLVRRAIAELGEAEGLGDSYAVTTPLKILLYLVLGEYKECSTPSELSDHVEKNAKMLMEYNVYTPLVGMVVRFMAHFTEGQNTFEHMPAVMAQNYFRILSLLYVLVTVLAKSRVESETINADFMKCLRETDLISVLVKAIEKWKWFPTKHLRMRYVLMLIAKLMLVEFGDNAAWNRCDAFLDDVHGITNKRGRDLPENKLTCSPLEYYSFREDLVDKYPLYRPHGEIKQPVVEEAKIDSGIHLPRRSAPLPSVEENYKFFMAFNSSASLANLIETPKTAKSHTVLSQLPTQTVHIATPVPSPNLAASDYMSGGEKIRRSYQVNQAMPFIYPQAGGKIPLAIAEADELFKNSIYESYSSRQMWAERVAFMRQERGFISMPNNPDNEIPSNAEFTSSEKLAEPEKDWFNKYPKNHEQIRALLRVEQFYAHSFTQLHTFVQILVETIKLNKLDYNLNFAEWELNPGTSVFETAASPDTAAKATVDHVLRAQLEVVNVKEITLKAASAILMQMLRWFKVSHSLKYHYLASIMFDQQFFAISLDYISKGFNNGNLQMDGVATDALGEYETLINQNKIMNPQIRIPKWEFVNNALNKEATDQILLINKTRISSLPKVLDSNNVNNVFIRNYNSNYCFILANLLQINDWLVLPHSTQRICTMNELKPSELYKMLLINYDCPAFSEPILHTLKKLIPYQGRKWKSSNMDLISQVYLNLKLSLKDNWLSGRDLESDFNNSYDQEIALRALLQFYNARHYPLQMEEVGYHVSADPDIPSLSLDDDN